MHAPTTLLLASVSLAILHSACAAPPPVKEDPKPVAVESPTQKPAAPLDAKVFGAAITETAATPLTAIAAEPGKFGGKVVRTEGVVTAVCQSMGCWMDVGDDAGTAHVKMAGHAFFVPKTASGHHAVVQGTVIGAPSGNACAGDGCGPQKVSKVEIEATGIQFVD
jgi:hypothetical protein